MNPLVIIISFLVSTQGMNKKLAAVTKERDALREKQLKWKGVSSLDDLVVLSLICHFAAEFECLDKVQHV